MVSSYSDGYILCLSGSQEQQGSAGTEHCLSVGLVWAPAVLGMCLWYLNRELKTCTGTSESGEGLSTLGLLFQRNTWLF